MQHDQRSQERECNGNGDGPLRGALESQIEARGLQGRFHLAGFRSDLDKYYPHLDLLALPSYTEGLPNVVLEAFAAGVAPYLRSLATRGFSLTVDAAMPTFTNPNNVSIVTGVPPAAK